MDIDLNTAAPVEDLDWKTLPFGYCKTDWNLRCRYRNGKWGEIEISASEYIEIHMAATGLHYGQQAFEGMKAYRGKDGRVRVFRWEENAKRMSRSAEALLMPPVPVELFRKAVFGTVAENRRYVPPYESGAALYIRPLLFGSGAQVGVKAASEYLFLVFSTPVGPYFKNGFHPVDLIITREYDRAAPLGTGHVKAGGNYAAGLRAMDAAKSQGYASVIFLDSKEKKYIDECGPANFFAIKGNSYITPDSVSILPSITNASLMALAEEMGMTVERRPVTVDELTAFDEVGACGTAAVITPVARIVDPRSGKVHTYCADGKAGSVSERLYRRLLAIQYGDAPDRFGWVTVVD